MPIEHYSYGKNIARRKICHLERLVAPLSRPLERCFQLDLRARFVVIAVAGET